MFQFKTLCIIVVTDLEEKKKKKIRLHQRVRKKKKKNPFLYLKPNFLLFHNTIPNMPCIINTTLFTYPCHHRNKTQRNKNHVPSLHDIGRRTIQSNNLDGLSDFHTNGRVCPYRRLGLLLGSLLLRHQPFPVYSK